MKKSYIAVDLGATSGRTILGWIDDGKFVTEDINRFPNHLICTGSHYYWDIFELYRNIIDGLRIVASRGITPTSIGIDTWGVDFVMVGADGGILRLPYAYRDPHTEGAPDRYFARVSREQVYATTGIQVMNFNSLFQLDTLRHNADSALSAAAKILFIPDALGYMLTGEMVTEYTIATTAQIVNAATRRIDADLIATVGLSTDNFGRFVYPGDTVGTLTPEVQQLTGLGPVPVIAVAGHDTASAVAAVPATTPDFAYLSSGTWSLMGVETSAPVINADTERLNFTNEGGVEGTVRLLKNICGMWLLERCRADWPDADYATLIAEAQAAEPFVSLINPDDPAFANPADMQQAIKDCCRDTSQPVTATRGALVRCIFESLALRYHQVLDDLKAIADHPIEVLHVIGGGCRNRMLNQMIANAIGINVVAGPPEATALGNIMVQAIAAGAGKDIAEMRETLKRSIPTYTYLHSDDEAWQAAYRKFLALGL